MTLYLLREIMWELFWELLTPGVIKNLPSKEKTSPEQQSDNPARRLIIN